MTYKTDRNKFSLLLETLLPANWIGVEPDCEVFKLKQVRFRTNEKNKNNLLAYSLRLLKQYSMEENGIACFYMKIKVSKEKQYLFPILYPLNMHVEMFDKNI